MRQTDFEQICVWPAGGALEDHYPDLKSLFYDGERVRDHLYLTVNGILPSELTWQDIIVPNSTNPGTAWIGTRNHQRYCWTAEIETGLYEVALTYPWDGKSETFSWRFTIVAP